MIKNITDEQLVVVFCLEYLRQSYPVARNMEEISNGIRVLCCNGHKLNNYSYRVGEILKKYVFQLSEIHLQCSYDRTTNIPLWFLGPQGVEYLTTHHSKLKFTVDPFLPDLYPNPKYTLAPTAASEPNLTKELPLESSSSNETPCENSDEKCQEHIHLFPDGLSEVD